MSAKENFNQAMFEMFGIGKEPEEKKEEIKAEAVKPAKSETKNAPKKEVKA